MTRRLLAIFSGISLLSISGVPTSAAVIGVPAGGSIQAAVDSALPGDTIQVSPGVFAERVRVNKSLTILGAQAGVDARTRTGQPETVLYVWSDAAGESNVENGFTISANSVTIDGFTIQREPSKTDDLTGRGVNMVGLRSGIQLQNNIFLNNRDAILTRLSVSGLIVKNNRFAGQLDSAVELEIESSPATAAHSNVVIEGNISDGDHLELTSTTTGLVVNNIVENTIGSAFYLRGKNSDILVQGNTFQTATTAGIRIDTSNIAVPNDNIRVIGNALLNNGEHGLRIIAGALGTHQIHHNRIVGNTVGLRNQDVSPVNAANNWWGCNEGPGLTGCDRITTSYTGTVNAAPWLMLNIDVDPNPVPGAGTAEVTADLTRNSSGEDTSTLGYVPDGTPVAFSAFGGSLDPELSSTSLGKATANLTVGTVALDVQATADNETVSETVNITSAPVNQNPDAMDDSATTIQGNPVTIFVLNNDSDPDQDSLTISNFTQASHGAVYSDGTTLTYVPDPLFTGTDTFSYTVSDGEGGLDTASVSVTVQPCPSPALSGVSVQPTNIAPADGRWVSVSVSYSATSACGSVSNAITVLNEKSQNVYVAGQDYQIVDAHNVLLRAWLNANKPRTYRIVVTSTDSLGRSVSRSANVTVKKK